MSSIVNKVKDALHSDKHDNTTTHHSGTTTTTTGTHGHSNPAEPRVGAGRDHRDDVTSTGAVGGTGAGYTASDNYTTGAGGVKQGPIGSGPGPATDTAGPHSSNMLNKADPRVDSNMDRSTNMGMNPHGTSTTSGPMSGTTGTTGTTHTTSHGAPHAGTTQHAPIGSGPGPATDTAGPHSSNMMNKADPRVDSDMDRSTNMGMNPRGTSTTSGPTSGATHHGTTHGTTGTTHGTTHQAPIDSGSGPTYDTAGPHNNNMMNKADPRVDSDVDRSRNMGMNPQGTSTTSGPMSGTTHTTTGNNHGVYNTSAPTGTHQTRGATGTSAIAGDNHNAHASHPQTGHTGLGGVSGTTTGTHDNSFNGSGPGPAANTAGPHKSDMMNKLDPRVDSNLDGSKTVGGDKTFQQS